MPEISKDFFYPIICVEIKNLSDTEKVKLIDYYHTAYFDTEYEIVEFANEFQRVVLHILSDRIPISLSYLADFVDDELLSILYDEHKEDFKAAYEEHKILSKG